MGGCLKIGNPAKQALGAHRNENKDTPGNDAVLTYGSGRTEFVFMGIAIYITSLKDPSHSHCKANCLHSTRPPILDRLRGDTDQHEVQKTRI